MSTPVHYYPLTKMNFVVLVPDVQGVAAFSEVTGIEGSVDVIEFRQGNAASLAPVKIQGLVKHGNVTLKMGYTANNNFKEWVKDCIFERRKATPRKNVTIELIDITEKSPESVVTATNATHRVWTLKNAWVTKYNGPDLDAKTSDVAMESVELAYEELDVPN